jgi:hypothetical protein
VIRLLNRGSCRLLDFFLVGLVFELKPSLLQSRHSTTWATPPVHFALVILEMGYQELFARAGFELWSSQSQPLK